jgi:hypothetical protein
MSGVKNDALAVMVFPDWVKVTDADGTEFAVLDEPIWQYEKMEANPLPLAREFKPLLKMRLSRHPVSDTRRPVAAS